MRTTAVLAAGLVAGLSVSMLVGCSATPRHDTGRSVGRPVVTGQPLADRDGYYAADWLIIAGQPDEAELAAMRDEGVTTVINLRSTREMDRLERAETGAFNQAIVVETAGMEYVHIPLGGDDGYSPDDLDAFAAAIEKSDGKVLVHCGSGGRARSMWAAYLISNRGYTPAEAEAVIQTLGDQPSATERLLGREVVPSKLGERLPAG